MNSLNVEQHCMTLQTVAERYAADTPEHQSIALAAKALLYIFMNGHTAEFIAQLDEYQQPDLRTDDEIMMEARKKAGRALSG